MIDQISFCCFYGYIILLYVYFILFYVILYCSMYTFILFYVPSECICVQTTATGCLPNCSWHININIKIRAQDSVNSESTAYISAPFTLVILYPEILNTQYDRHSMSRLSRPSTLYLYHTKSLHRSVHRKRTLLHIILRQYVENRNRNHLLILDYFNQKLGVSFWMSALALECLLLWIRRYNNRLGLTRNSCSSCN
jgi:hypothetical protein